MNLEQCVENIIKEIKSGIYFDSHAVINELISKPDYHNEYLKKYREYDESLKVNLYHGQIAQMIGRCASVKPAGRAISHTIYGDLIENELWQKI